MPWWPSLTGEGTGPRGEQATGTPEEELADSLAYYRSLTDDPGEVVVPLLPDVDPGAFADRCADRGATWLLTTDLGEDLEDAMSVVRAGPPT